MFEEFNNNCSSYLIASGYVCIDECQYPLRNQWGGKCYNPSKPNKACTNENIVEIFTHNFFYLKGRVQKNMVNSTSYWGGSARVISYFIFLFQMT